MIAQNGNFLSQDMDDISALFKEVFKRHYYRMTAYSFHNFVSHIYVSIIRIKQEKEIDFTFPEQNDIDDRIKNLAKDLVIMLEKKYDISFSTAEFLYILLHLECKRITSDSSRATVSLAIYKIVSEMLKEVQKVFHYDLQYDFKLITNLSLHIVPLRLRLLYDIPF